MDLLYPSIETVAALCRISKVLTSRSGYYATARRLVMRWEFVTRPVQGSWLCSLEQGVARRDERGTRRCSLRTFSTFRECVADARLDGFTGNPDPAGLSTFFRRPEARFRWS